MGGNQRPDSSHRIVRQGNVLFGANDEIARWIEARVPGYAPSPGVKCLAVIRKDRIAAGVAFERFNGKHIEASIAADLNGQWADRRTLFTLFAYPFLQLGVEAISVLVAATNLPSVNLATKLGFSPVAFIPFAAQDGSALIVLQMYRGECRWLSHGKKQGTRGA